MVIKNAEFDDDLESVEISQKSQRTKLFCSLNQQMKNYFASTFYFINFFGRIVCYFFTRFEINIKYLGFLVPNLFLWRICLRSMKHILQTLSSKCRRNGPRNIFIVLSIRIWTIKLLKSSHLPVKYKFCIRLQSLLLSILWIRQ